MPGHSTDLICLSRSDFFETHEELRHRKNTNSEGLDEEELGLVGKSSVSKGVFNVLCALIGGGVLGLSHALKQSGWYGLIMLIIMGGMATYTAILIGRCVSYDYRIKSYADIGLIAFQRPGKISVFVMQFASCLGCSIIYLILIGENMASMLSRFPDAATILLNQKFWSSMAILLVLPLCYMKNLETFAFMAFIGMLLSVIAVICIIIAIAMLNNEALSYHHYGGVGFGTFLSGFATMAFSYAAHPVFPDIQRVMKYPERFNRVSYISFGICISLYVLSATLGYYTFGEHTLPNVLLNFDNSVPLASSMPALIAKICITFHVLFGYVVYLNPIFFVLERRVGLAQMESKLNRKPPLTMILSSESSIVLGDTNSMQLTSEALEEKIKTPLQAVSYNDLQDSSLPQMADVSPSKSEKPPSRLNRFYKKFSFRVLRIVLRTLVVAFTLAIAIVLPFFGDLMDFIGGSTLSATFLILPCLFHLKLFWKTLSIWEIVLNIGIVLFGLFAGSVACVFAVINMVHKIPSWHF